MTIDAPFVAVDDLACHFRGRATGLPLPFLRRPAPTVAPVDGVSFQIPRGGTLGLVGESGCGKSTTARAVLGLTPITRGRVTVDGQPVPRRRDAAWRHARRRMQMVYQDTLGALDPRLPVLAQLREPLDIHRIGDSRDRCDRALALLREVGLDGAVARRRPQELSGGQRQRVVLARALILDPAFLVCDEPVSALDVSVQAQVLNLLDDLRQTRGLTTLFISHDLKVVRQVSDRVAVMYLGRIVEQGPVDMVLHQPSHPYSRALVASVAGRRDAAGLASGRVRLAGDPPDPARRPQGCAFHPRCPLATGLCRTTPPPMRPAGAGRMVACHLVAETGSTAAVIPGDLDTRPLAASGGRR
ncbi:ABC transporter ATP-binding protein (plasmid) [Tistrella bauzanensis]|jgi:peptide/nickel transport system ATP-binding protein|uniref:ABC transporter ATP-binding protein n=1 Tax=Tistrella arctica TaxID=3133430 RepID=A0ABU9YLB4_9PROT